MRGAVIAVVCAAVLWVLPDVVGLQASFWRLASVTLLYVIAVMGLNLVFGLAGQVTLGPAAVFAAGAYVAGVLTARFGWDAWLAVVAGVAAAGVIGVLIGAPALRVGGFYLAMVTAIAAQTIPAGANVAKGLTGGQDGLVGIGALTLLGEPLDTVSRYRLAVVATLVVALLVANVARSAWGRWFRCLTVSEIGTSAIGVSVYRAKVVAFFLSALFGGLAGALYALFQRVISPMEFSFELSLTLFASLVIGGLGSLWGPVLGTVLFVLGQHYLLPGAWGPIWAQVVYGVVLVAVMVLIPEGVASAGAPFTALLRRVRGPARASATGLRPGAADTGALRALLRAAGRLAPGELVLRAEEVSKRFGGVRALHKSYVEVHAGRITALIGPNGSGKTTLLNVCCGYTSMDGGRVLLRGGDVSREPAYLRARAGIGRTLQHSVLFPQLTGGQSVMAGHREGRPSPWAAMLALPSSRRYERAAAVRAEGILAALGAAHLVKKSGRAMSLAESRILDLARALALDPIVLLLDEPAAGLDLDEVEVVAAMVRGARDAGIGVLLVDHDVSFVTKLADRVIVLDQGAVIYDGAPAGVRADTRVAAAYFGELDPGVSAA
jgi:ABC-type branched-subunit amino acid transport system ATPase component/ABC-type branched-subunit amino acid transport system permease subunit